MSSSARAASTVPPLEDNRRSEHVNTWTPYHARTEIAGVERISDQLELSKARQDSHTQQSDKQAGGST